MIGPFSTTLIPLSSSSSFDRQVLINVEASAISRDERKFGFIFRKIPVHKAFGWRKKRIKELGPDRPRFSIPVLAPCSEYFAYLSLLTHLIQIISSLEVRSVHELCSDWHAPYTVSIAPYSPSRGNPLKFTSLRNIHSWICTAQRLHAQTRVTSYTSVNIYNLNSRLAHFNALLMEYMRSLRTGILVEYPVMSTSQGTYSAQHKWVHPLWK